VLIDLMLQSATPITSSPLPLQFAHGVKNDPNSNHDIFCNYAHTEELISQFNSKMPSLQEW